MGAALKQIWSARFRRLLSRPTGCRPWLQSQTWLLVRLRRREEFHGVNQGSIDSLPTSQRCARCVCRVRSLLAARIAPVMAPLVIEFQGSSLPRTFTKPQSIMENSPPHTAKLPATHNKTDFTKPAFPLSKPLLHLSITK